MALSTAEAGLLYSPAGNRDRSIKDSQVTDPRDGKNLERERQRERKKYYNIIRERERENYKLYQERERERENYKLY